MIYIRKVSLQEPNIYLLSNDDLIINYLNINNDSYKIFHNIKDFCTTIDNIYLLDNNGIVFIYKNHILTQIFRDISKIIIYKNELHYITYNGKTNLNNLNYSNTIRDIVVNGNSKLTVYDGTIHYQDNSYSFLLNDIDTSYLFIRLSHNYITMFFRDKKIIYHIVRYTRKGKSCIKFKSSYYQIDEEMINSINVDDIYTVDLFNTGLCKIHNNDMTSLYQVIDIYSQQYLLYILFNDGSIYIYVSNKVLIKLDIDKIVNQYLEYENIHNK